MHRFRRLVRLVVATTLVVSPGIAAPSSLVRAGNQQTSSASFSGLVRCADGKACKEWEHASDPGARSWTKSDAKSGGGSRSSGSVGFTEVWDSSGRFVSTTVTVHLEASTNDSGTAGFWDACRISGLAAGDPDDRSATRGPRGGGGGAPPSSIGALAPYPESGC